MNINNTEVETVLKELHKISGFRISLHGEDFREIAAYPKNNLPFCHYIQETCNEQANCHAGDKAACLRAAKEKKTIIYTCRYGLIEAVSPLYDYGTLTGYLMMGQVLSTPIGEHVLKKNAKELVEKIPKIANDMIPSFVHIMTICAKYLTLSNAIPPSSVSLAYLARDYIHQNLGSKTTISDICNALRCSKTSLLTSFKREFNTTVNSYITEKRLDLAKKMLSGTSSSISEIAKETGFSDQSYFSKVFSARYGIPPSEYGKVISKK